MHDPFRNYDQWKTASPPEYDEDEDPKMVTMYCPSCGEYNRLPKTDEMLVAPTTEWYIICPNCGTKFNVVIGFYEITDDT